MKNENELWKLIEDREYHVASFDEVYAIVNGRGNYIVIQGFGYYFVEAWWRGRVLIVETTDDIEKVRELIPWDSVKRIIVSQASDTVLFEVPEDVVKIMFL